MIQYAGTFFTASQKSLFIARAPQGLGCLRDAIMAAGQREALSGMGISICALMFLTLTDLSCERILFKGAIALCLVILNGHKSSGKRVSMTLDVASSSRASAANS